MKTVAHILSRLESLSSSDRQWIVERLPDDAKTWLMDELTADSWGSERTAAYHPAATGTQAATVERIPPRIAADILENEAPWLVASILHSANPVWTSQVMNALPAGIRSSVQDALRKSRRAPAALLTSLHSTLINKASRELPTATAVSAGSRWRKWVGRLLPGAAT